jgi:hypothetical protein
MAEFTLENFHEDHYHPIKNLLQNYCEAADVSGTDCVFTTAKR